MLEMLRLAPPVFVNETGCAALDIPTNCGEKLREPVDKDTAAGVRPVPLKETTRLVPLVPFTVKSPARGPIVVGANETVKSHGMPIGTPGALPGAPIIGHALLCVKSDVV